jgi:hypothetical protein
MIDEEMFVPANRLVNAKGEDLGPTVSKQVASLLFDIVEDLQLKLHNKQRAQMDKTDVRQRVANLSRADKNALHELCWLAERGLSLGPCTEQDIKASEAGRAVIDKVTR